MTWFLPEGLERKIMYENSLVDNRGVLGICVKYYGEIM